MTSTNNFVTDPLPNFIPSLPDSILPTESFYELSSTTKETSREFDLLPEIDDLIHNRNDRIALSVVFSSSEDEKLIDLLNVAESNIAKTKERPRESKNKKGTITRKEKKVAKSTKRDFSKFEHVKREIQAKRVKKNLDKIIVSKTTVSKTTQGREGRDREENKEKTTTAVSRPPTSITTRSGDNAARSMILFNNTESSQDSSDDEFDASKQGDENVKNE